MKGQVQYSGSRCGGDLLLMAVVDGESLALVFSLSWPHLPALQEVQRFVRGEKKVPLGSLLQNRGQYTQCSLTM